MAAVFGVLLGISLAFAGADDLADGVWIVVTLAGVGPAAWWVGQGLRQRRVGVDVVALLALLGTLAVGEYLAGAVIAAMLATGRTLEAVADAKARHDLEALVSRQPTTVHRYRDTELVSEPISAVGRSDLLLVKPGEVIPVDGVVANGAAVLDESSLTGEAMPVEHPAGEAVRSGTINAGGPFDLRATAAAAASTYAGVVRMVEQAEASSAPFVRLADRYAAAFLAISLSVAGVAWAASGQAERAVAVLVVATPCPLILAAPIALVAGMARAARRGVIVKGGSALERLARGRVLLFDKTGTLTVGRPSLTDVAAAADVSPDELLRLSASLDQVSSHVLASAVEREAVRRQLPLSFPEGVVEQPAMGLRGRVDGREVAVGKAAWVGAREDDRWVRRVRRRADLDGSLTVFVGVDGVPAGALLFDDPIRLDAAHTIQGLRRHGIDRVVMVTGDHADVAATVGTVIGADEVLADRTPGDKVDAVVLARRWGPTIMVGDGLNDAAALAIADVGVALGARGASASSEAADVVILVDRLDRLGEGVGIARRTRSIAVQSVVVGMGLSLIAMGFAAAGLIAAVWGALLQEALDVTAIASALRALGRPRTEHHPAKKEVELVRRFGVEHLVLVPELERVRVVADALGDTDPRPGLQDAQEVHRFLAERLLPHEWAEDERLYPVLSRALGGEEPMASMRREHVEIAHQVRRLGRLLSGVDPDDPDDADVLEVRRLLYGLYAILRLHFAKEDERYFTFADGELELIAPATGRS
jgi:heavy metal translocating P-type ATPase